MTKLPEAVESAIALLDTEIVPCGAGSYLTLHGVEELRAAIAAAIEAEREACVSASIDVIRAVMRELDEFSKGEVAENGYIDEGDDDGTGHTPFRNGWTLYGFARNEMCGVLTKVPAAIRARGNES